MGNRDYIIVAVSSWLSMIGSSFVALTTLYPFENRRKIGKALLFWLSLSDFFTSCVYFVQIFDHSHGNSDYCKAIGLLGIFFPVSSFIWTDLIAYYLFSVISQRNQMDAANIWEGRMKYCHVVAWGIPIIIVGIVGIAGRAGTDSGNTWCWIREDPNPSIEFVWEFVGGKCIEWISCFIILPALYTSAACQLRRIEVDTEKPLVSAIENIRSPASFPKDRDSERDMVVHKSSSTTLTISPAVSPTPNKGSNGNTASSSSGSNSYNGSVNNSPAVSTSGVGIGGGSRKIRLFGRFYIKMAAVPVVFLFIRFWGSLRVFLNYFDSDDAKKGWLRTLVDIFDPSQGFFNAVLFVLMSRDGQRSVLLAFSLFLATCFYFIPGALQASMYLESLSAKKHVSAGFNSNPADGRNDALRFSKYNKNNMTTELSNPMLPSAYSGAFSTNDFSLHDEEEIAEYGRSNSLGSQTSSTNLKLSM